MVHPGYVGRNPEDIKGFVEEKLPMLGNTLYYLVDANEAESLADCVALVRLLKADGLRVRVASTDLDRMKENALKIVDVVDQLIAELRPFKPVA